MPCSLLRCLLIASLVVLALGEVESRERRSPYHVYSLDSTCPPSGGKREIKLRTGAAIFILNEMKSQGTRNLLAEKDLSCHLEVEAPSGFGFHVFMEELSLDEGGGGQGCDDYIQFGRDVLYITTMKSSKFCGQRSAVNFHNITLAEAAMVVKQGQRWYVEEKDHEMDIWIKIRRNALGENRGTPNHPSWRRIVLVVTVFKQSCGQKDLFYKQCKHSNYCIRKDFFCDLRANCAWPSGDLATDETGCDEYLAGSYAIKSSFLKPSSIPVLLIIAIVISVGMVGVVIALRRLIIGAQPPDAYSEVRRTSVHVPHHPGGHADLALTLPEPYRAEASAPPPSYEDVVKDSRVGTGISDKPPPYTESSL